MRTYLIGAAAVALSMALGACNDGSVTGGTAGAANTTAGSSAGAAAGGSSSTAGAGTLPMAGATSGLGGDASSGGTSNSGGAVNAGGTPSTSGGSSGGVGTAGAGAGGTSGGAGGSGGTGVVTGPFKILILSTTLEFHHDSIPDCQYMMGLESAKATAQMHWSGATPISTAWTADLATDDLAQFTDATLKNYAMVFSCSPTGTVFSNNAKVKDKVVAMAAFQHFVEGGGAWGGVHSATDFEKTNGFPWFTNTLAGAYFVSHPADPNTPGTVQTDPTNATSPVLTGINATYSTTDEWYAMNRDVSSQPGFKILQRLAPDSRPLTWTKEIANPGGGMGGRMFYTVRGHSQSVYKESEFRKLVLQGVLWATRRN